MRGEEAEVWSPLWEQWPQGLVQGAEKVEMGSRCVPNLCPPVQVRLQHLCPKMVLSFCLGQESRAHRGPSAGNIQISIHLNLPVRRNSKPGEKKTQGNSTTKGVHREGGPG